MNFKTTAILLVLVAGLAITIFMLPDQRVTIPNKPSPFDTAAKVKTQKLIAPEFGEVKRIKVSQPDSPDWMFQKSESENGGDATWMMEMPYACDVQKWQVESIASKLKKLEFTSKSNGSSGGLTAANTGLEPSRATVSLTDENEKTIHVHIGRDEGSNEAYVSLDDDTTIYRVNASLKSLLKKNALAYLNQKMFDVQIDDIVRIEIQEPDADGNTESYVMVKTGSEWRFEKPSPAKGRTDKIRRLCSTFAALRAQEWVAGHVSELSQYGLTANTRTVIVTTEKAGAQTNANSNGESIASPPTVTKYQLHISSANPLGEDTKVYARRGDETIVGTVAKNLADVFSPNLKEWRDNRLIERDPATARSLTLTQNGTSTRFERSGPDWSFSESRRSADNVAVNRLLTAIKDLKAVNFVPPGSVTQSDLGFDQPKGIVELMFDGDTPSVTFTVGGLTDTASRKLTYVSANNTIAKVKTHDVATLLQSPTAYRDSTIVALPKDRLQSITIHRSTDTTTEPDMTFTMTQTDGKWSMSSPVQHSIDEGQMERLLSTLANLRATKIIDVNEGDDLSPYGLDHPTVRLTYTILPPKAYRVIPDAITSNGANRVEHIQPPAETFELAFGKANANVYVQHAATPNFVYLIPETLLADFLAEYRVKTIFAFEPDQVTAITFTDAGATLGLEKNDSEWTYAQEPDLPIDQAKAANYLLRVKNIKIARVIEYSASDLARYGLDTPRYQLMVTSQAGSLPALLVSENKDSQGNHFAKSADSSDVFTVPAETISQVAIDVDEFEQAG